MELVLEHLYSHCKELASLFPSAHPHTCHKHCSCRSPGLGPTPCCYLSPPTGTHSPACSQCCTLSLCTALLDLHSLALLCLCLHILCVPHYSILCSAGALWTTLYRCWSFHWLGYYSSIL